jgi:hypothetical protein
MLRFNARILLDYSTEELWDILTGRFVLVFDDGEELEVCYKSTLYSSYVWDFHREYKETPLLSKHHAAKILGDNPLGSGTHLELLGNAQWSVYDHIVLMGNKTLEYLASLRDKLFESVYRLDNKMYNDLTYRAERFVISLDITDFSRVMSHPEIKKANDDIQCMDVMNLSRSIMEQRIEYTYGVISNVLLRGTDMLDNPIVKASRAKLVNMGQVLQCLGPRGFLTDVDSNVFRIPILRGFYHGMRKFHDSLIESRSSAKSLAFSKSPLQDSEYFSRRLQLMAETVRHLHHGNCGSKRYTLWHVRGSVDSKGSIIEPCDLYRMIGKHYYDSDGNEKIITKKDKHLIGTTIKLRSILGCEHPDPYGVCSACFGDLSLSVAPETNIGQMTSSSFAQKSSQSVLSVRHEDGSSVVDGIQLDDYCKTFVAVGADESSYLLAAKLKNSKVSLILDADSAANITDINDVDDIYKLNITRVVELEEIGFAIGSEQIDKEGMIYGSIPVNVARRKASFTYQLLAHIKKYGWSVNEAGNYVFDMSEWDFSMPILTLPLKHINMSDHSHEIAELLESSVTNMYARDKLITPSSLLVELFNLVNDKLTVNLAVLEVVLYSAMIISAEDGDYSLPKPWTDSSVGVMALTMTNRSMGSAMAFEYHADNLKDPNNYIHTNRMDHLMDGILMPAEYFACN